MLQKAGWCFSCILQLFLTSCFALREPEPPATSGGWTSPTQPSILLTNFQQAVTTLNPVNYERCFVPAQFRFMPDANTPGSTTGLFANWSAIEERTYLTRLKENASTNNNLSLSDTQEIYYNTDSLEINTRYNLRILHTDTAFRHFNFQGQMRLTLTRKQNEWKISTWQDNRTTDSLCWTDLKKYFYTH